MGQKNSKQNKINRRDTAKINTRNIFHDAVDLEEEAEEIKIGHKKSIKCPNCNSLFKTTTKIEIESWVKHKKSCKKKNITNNNIINPPQPNNNRIPSPPPINKPLFFCDFHGHSNMPNCALYCCSPPKKKKNKFFNQPNALKSHHFYEEKVFMRIFEEDATYYQKSGEKYNIQKSE